jgi:RHS repeat-associated protein
VTAGTNVRGTVSGPTLANWVLEYRLQGDPTYTAFASGTTPVVSGTLGLFDPTLLLNGLYEIRLTATNSNGRSASTSVNVVVEGGLKVGNFTLSFVDQEVPVAGLPIQVLRTYDSRDKHTGDFGVGWTLDYKGVRLQENGVLGNNWSGTRDDAFFTTYCIQPSRPHLVTISLPDGTVYKFEASVSPRCQLFYPQADVAINFQPLPGTNGTLVPLDARDAIVSGNFPGSLQLLDFNTFAPVDPNRYQLTLEDGRVLTIDQQAGLQTIQDLNGNTISIQPNGIIHSSGKSMLFQRDAQGRITRITDPKGQKVNYGYDANGDLTMVTDQENLTTTFAYNGSHGLLSIQDPRGVQPLQNEYDSDGRLIATTDARGNRVQFTHNIGSRQEVVRDRLGHISFYAYDDRGNVLSQTDAMGNTTTFAYDSFDNKLRETDPLGNTSTFTYDTHRNLLTETDPSRGTRTYTYTGANQPLTIRDARGNVTTNAYDLRGNLVSVRDPLSNTTTYTYNSQGNNTSATDSLGNTTYYQSNSAGYRVRETNPLGNAATYAYDANGNRLTQVVTRTNEFSGTVIMTTTNVYDAKDRLTRVTDPAGNVSRTEFNSVGVESALIDGNGTRTNYSYDSMRNLSAISRTDGMTATLTYDANGNVLTSTDRSSRTTRYEYDALNRKTRTIFPDSSSTRTEYDARGKVTAVIDENGNRTAYEYDASGRNTRVTDALGNATTFAYDANGNKTSMTDANGHTTAYMYDALNRIVRTTFHDGSFTTYTYDGQGRRTGMTDQAGKATQYSYDALDRLVRVTDALSQTTTYAYDQTGNKVTQTDAGNHTTRWAYDSTGRVTRRTLPLGMSESYTYDANSNILTKTDFNGQTVSYTYDARNHLIQKTYPDASRVQIAYTATGQRSIMTDTIGTTTYGYDLRDRLTLVGMPGGNTLTYTYDAHGNRTSVAVASGTTTYTYDALNRPAAATGPNSMGTTYTYDAVGNRASVTYPNSTIASYTYNTLNRLTVLSNRKSTGETISAYTYTLGLAGNRLSVQEDTGRRVDYTFDALYRLTGEIITGTAADNQNIAYTYDPAGNRLTKTNSSGTTTYVYDANDRLTSGGGITYTYDNNGNTLSSSGSLRKNARTTATTYTYDFENRMIAAQAGSVTTTYAYDADGARTSSTTGGTKTNYVVDKNRDLAQVLEERNGSGGLIASYVYGDDLVSQNRIGVLSFYHYDGLGSVRQLSNSSGQVTDSYTYDAFGTVLASTGSTQNNYLFTGEQYDPNVGFYYLRARYYAPANGRFLTQDPIEGDIFAPASLHKYVYARDDPVDFVDPSGLFSSVAAIPSIMVDISRVASAIIPTVLKAVSIFAATKVLWEPGFRLREMGIMLLASDYLGPQGYDNAMKIYTLGVRLIAEGANYVDAVSNALGHITLAFGFAGLARAVVEAPPLFLNPLAGTPLAASRDLGTFEHLFFRIESATSRFVLQTATILKSNKSTDVLSNEVKTLVKLIGIGQKFFFKVVSYYVGQTK